MFYCRYIDCRYGDCRHGDCRCVFCGRMVVSSYRRYGCVVVVVLVVVVWSFWLWLYVRMVVWSCGRVVVSSSRRIVMCSMQLSKLLKFMVLDSPPKAGRKRKDL